MSLVLRHNKKDITYNHAIWTLQKFDFMTFSDTFVKLNLHGVLNPDKS